MKELTQIRDAVLEALSAGGLTALAAFPAERARAYDGAAVSVAVGAAEGKALGFCSYLGEAYDPASGTFRERYGRLLEGVISVDVRAARAAECEGGCEAASEILLGGLPEGIRPGELRWEALAWEKAGGMFLRRGSLRCQAVFTAESREDEGAPFLDFILKGVRRA